MKIVLLLSLACALILPAHAVRPGPATSVATFQSQLPDEVTALLLRHWKAITASSIAFEPVVKAYAIEGATEAEMRVERDLLCQSRAQLAVWLVHAYQGEAPWWHRLTGTHQYMIATAAQHGPRYLFEVAVTAGDVRLVRISRTVT